MTISSSTSQTSLSRRFIHAGHGPSFFVNKRVDIFFHLQNFDQIRAYINFPNFDDVLRFRDRFDGQIFEDKRGQEYPAFVEVSPFQLIPKNRNHECKYKGSIKEDPEFIKFKEKFENDVADEVQQVGNRCKFCLSYCINLQINIEAYLKEAAAKEDARKQTQSTPLIDFIRFFIEKI